MNEGFKGTKLKPSLVSNLLKRLKAFDILEKTKKGMNEYDRPCEK